MNINDYSVEELQAEMMNRKIKPLSEMTDQEIEAVLKQKTEELNKVKDEVCKKLIDENNKNITYFLKYAESRIKEIDEMANRPSIFSRLFMKIKGDK